jgi:hypothetical protein
MESGEHRETKLMSVAIADVMAIVAMLGAVVACLAAFTEHETLRLERRLQQGKVLEFVHRQEMLNKISNLSRYEYTQYVNRIEAKDDLERAQQLRSSEPARAAALTLQAQEDNAVRRSLLTYQNFLSVRLPRSLEESLQEDAATELRGYGFDTHWVDPAKRTAGQESIWKNAEVDVNNARDRVVDLTRSVLLFVTALAFLTFAQLSLANGVREQLLLFIGILFAIAGIVVAVWVDHTSWIYLTLCLGAFALLVPAGLAVWRKMQFVPADEVEPIHPSEVEPTLFPGVRVHTAPVAHRFGRITIALIAITAVLSAGSGLLYSRATSKSAAAFSEALENQGTLFKTKSSNGASFFNTMMDASTREEYLVRYEAASQRVDLARENPGVFDLKTATAQTAHWKLLLQGLSMFNEGLHRKLESDVGPEQDRHFPHKMWSQSQTASARAFAMSDANNELSLNWQGQAATYLAMLTCFAIALYLFGQSLSMGRTRDACVLVVFSCFLVAGSLIYGMSMSWDLPHLKSHAASPECQSQGKSREAIVRDAARHYAEGVTLFNEGFGDPEELAKAAAEFGCSVDLRDTFAMGNISYALSTQMSETPQLNESGFISITSKKSIPSIVEHEEQALKMIEKQGLKTPAGEQVNLGFDSLLQGLLQGDHKMVERSVRETQEGVNLDKGNLVAQFNLGLGLLADNQKKEGIAVYEQAMKRVQGRGDIVAGAITDLDILHRYCAGGKNAESDCEEITGQIIPRLKSEMVAATWPPKVHAQGEDPPKIVDLQLITTAHGFGWQTPQLNLDRKRDVLSVLWYAYNPEWETWRVLPLISGRADWKLEQGMVSDSTWVLTDEARSCVVDGTYRVELYVNGGLAGTQDVSTHHGKFLPVVFPTQNLAMCYPQSWRSWEANYSDTSAFVKGYVSDAGSSGIFLFSYFNPRLQPDNVSLGRYLTHAITYMTDHNLTPRLASPSAATNCAGQPANPGEPLIAYSGGSAAAMARVGMETDGLVHVAVAFDNTGKSVNCDALMSVRRGFLDPESD